MSEGEKESTKNAGAWKENSKCVSRRDAKRKLKMTNYPKKLSEPEILRTRIMKGKKNRKPQQIGKSKQNTTQKYTNSKIQNKIPQGKTGWETTKNVQKMLENVFLPKNYRRGQHQPIFSPCSSMAAANNFAKKTTASPGKL